MAGTTVKVHYDIVPGTQLPEGVYSCCYHFRPKLPFLFYVCTSKGVPVTHEEDAAGLIGSGFAAEVKKVNRGVDIKTDQQQKYGIDQQMDFDHVGNRDSCNCGCGVMAGSLVCPKAAKLVFMFHHASEPHLCISYES